MSASDIHDSRYSWFRLGVTLVIAAVANVGIWAVVLILPALETELSLSRAEASLPYTLTMIGFGLGNLLIGRIVDRFGVTAALIGASILSASAYLATTAASGLLGISMAHLLIGLGTGVGFGPLIADISHWFMRRRGIAVALVASGNYLSGAIWPTLLTGMLEKGGWRDVYSSLAVITLVLVIPLALLLRRRLPYSAHQVAEKAASLRALSVGLSPRALTILLGFAGIACCVAMSMPQVHIVAYCVGLGYGPAIGAEMLSLMLLGGVVSRVISGMIADKLGGAMTLLIGSALQCIALFLFLPWDGMVSLYLISAIFGLSQGGIVPSYAVIVREYMSPKEAGERVGFVIMMTVVGMALGGWMSGWIYDLSGSYQLAFLNGILWNGVNLAIVVLLLVRSRPRRARPVASSDPAI